MPNPVTYAEETLGVHDVYAECRTRLQGHDEARNIYLDAIAQLRDLRAAVTTREAEITSDERGEHPEMKITAFKDHLKVVFEADTVHMAYRDEIAIQEIRRDQAESEMRHHELGIRALTARMHELAGLLAFYGAAKEAKKHGA